MIVTSNSLHPIAILVTAYSGGLWRLTFATCAVLFGAACADGYPTEDAPNAVDMTQSQRLGEMNQIGDQPYLDLPWRYELLPDCKLKVVQGTRFTNRQAFVVPLVSSQVVRSVDRVDKTYDVHLQFVGQPSTTKFPVLEGGSWVDTTELISLLKHVQRDCRRV